MKNKLFKITLSSLFIAQSIVVANAETISKNTGSTAPLQSEFVATTWNYPPQIPGIWRATYNETKVDRMFMETFRLKIPKRCKVAKAQFQVRVKNLGAQNHNDALYMTDNGGANLFGQKLWTNEGVGFTKTLSFNLGSLPPAGGLVISRPSASILHTLSDGKFSFFIQDDTSVQFAKLTYVLSGRGCGGNGNAAGIKGMTWTKKGRDATTGVVTVGCKHGGYNCNPSNGDQLCTVKHPILCKRELNTPKPASVAEPNKYTKWSGEIVHTSRLVAPATEGIGTLTQANKVCSTEFGKGWKVAGFHDGWAWNFTAYGNTGKKGKRFWVNIKDKPNGNCWNQQ